MNRRRLPGALALLFCIASASSPASEPGPPRFTENSLGMKIARLAPEPGRFPAPPTMPNIRFAAWPTRVRDFAAFVTETKYDATAEMLSLGRDGWRARGASWRDPGFAQTDDHPVVGVSYGDALAFCRWLTNRERARGLIAMDECYRLPSDAEWQLLIATAISPDPIGARKYLWGAAWPPRPSDGNFAFEEVLTFPAWPEGWDCIRGVHDKFQGTAPVNRQTGRVGGFADLSGNVWQWTSTPFRKELNSPEIRARYPFLDSDTDVTGKPSKVIRGGCWNDYFPGLLELNTRGAREPHNRNSGLGFRVVLAPGNVPPD